MSTHPSGPLPHTVFDRSAAERADTGSVYDNVRAQIIGGMAIGGTLIAGATVASGFLGGPLLAIGVGLVGTLVLAGLLVTGRR